MRVGMVREARLGSILWSERGTLGHDVHWGVVVVARILRLVSRKAWKLGTWLVSGTKAVSRH